MFFCFPKCRKTVGSLTGLADDDCQGIFIQNRAAISELGCQFHTHRNADQIFHHILGCHSHMIGRATGHNVNLADMLYICIRQAYFCQIDGIVL